MAAAKQEGLLQARLEMPVAALDRSVFVRNTAIVSGRLHAIVRAQRLVTRPKVVSGIAVEIGEGRRKAVRAVLVRAHPAATVADFLTAVLT